MASCQMAPIGPRPRIAPRTRVLVVFASLLALATGCHHQRSSLRPVYVTPAPAAVAPDPCPSGVGAPAVSPGSGAIPTVPEVQTQVVPPSGGASRSLGEPPLESGTGTSGTTTSPTRPNLQGPQSLAPQPRSAARPSGRAVVRARVRSFVNDPDDLFHPPKADRPWQYIVLHHSAHKSGGYAQIDRDHRANLGALGCGYHFVIGNGTDSPDGQIEVAQRWSDQRQGAHCRNGKRPEVNEYGIGICLVGDLDQSPPTPRQIQAARALVAYLCDRYRIPTDHVGPHAVLAAGPTACPGKHFPVQAILGTRSLVLRDKSTHFSGR